MPHATPAERRDVAAYLSAGSMKGAACALGITEDALRTRFSRHYARHRFRNITELAVRVMDAQAVQPGPFGPSHL